MTGAPRASVVRAARRRTGQPAVPLSPLPSPLSPLPVPASVGQYMVSRVLRSPGILLTPVLFPQGNDIAWHQQPLFRWRGSHRGQCARSCHSWQRVQMDTYVSAWTHTPGTGTTPRPHRTGFLVGAQEVPTGMVCAATRQQHTGESSPDACRRMQTRGVLGLAGSTSAQWCV
jgi:hypothetical protein